MAIGTRKRADVHYEASDDEQQDHQQQGEHERPDYQITMDRVRADLSEGHFIGRPRIVHVGRS